MIFYFQCRNDKMCALRVFFFFPWCFLFYKIRVSDKKFKVRNCTWFVYKQMQNDTRTYLLLATRINRRKLVGTGLLVLGAPHPQHVVSVSLSLFRKCLYK